MSLKVCLFIASFGAGGAERHVVNLARALAGRGVQVILLHTQKNLDDAHYLDALRDQRVELVYAGQLDFLRRGIKLSKQHPVFYANIPASGQYRTASLYLAGAFDYYKPDVVHSFIDVSNCTAGCAAVLAAVPVHLASFCSLDPATLGDSTTLWTVSLYRYLLAHGQPHFEACSMAAAQHYARWLGIAPEAVACSHNGLDPEVYLDSSPSAGVAFREARGIPPFAPVLLSLSRFVPCKAPESIVEVCARVLASRPDCHCLIAGSGMAEEGEMAATVRARGLGEHVHLLGVQGEVAPLFASADVFLLPSRFEGFPVSIMEAMAMGVPTVASNVGGIPELVRHGQDGFLHDPADTDGMAQSVLSLMADADLRASFGKSGRQRVLEEFSMAKTADHALQLYKEFLGDRAAGLF